MDRNTVVELVAHANWDAIAEAIGLICETSTDGLEDWLSASQFPTVATIAELAAEWDEFNG
jgi:hypothetical protein